MQQNLPSEEGKKDLDPKQKTDRIVELGSSVVTNHHGTIHCLTIIGQIEGHTNAPDNAKTTKYEHLLPLLASLEESDDVDGVLILLNTVGGDVEAGLAMAEMIAGIVLTFLDVVCEFGFHLPEKVEAGHHQHNRRDHRDNHGLNRNRRIEQRPADAVDHADHRIELIPELPLFRNHRAGEADR